MAKQTTTPLPICPMAESCKGMMSKRSMGVAPLVMGAVFIVLGIAILIEPRIFVWVLAAMLILIGAMLLVMASFMRKMGERFQSMRQSMN